MSIEDKVLELMQGYEDEDCQKDGWDDYLSLVDRYFVENNIDSVISSESIDASPSYEPTITFIAWMQGGKLNSYTFVRHQR